ncbi:aminoglycoside 6-adenylyltransferase [Aestuariibacter halophilus]|uniref:Aminoglycoside 6-adenylyltransferase n=1 Tax=Fluctibacter halophilus TaxID=226011 RepID=A0ABS8G5H4_9ALTE|nr:aminoglycoside 6-adenylyltransferase [Aestuariibacter halophilus]MCC2615743.1 aminoglycoside 6-adenylyltransferase [Aestuariibacter halophilus]
MLDTLTTALPFQRTFLDSIIKTAKCHQSVVGLAIAGSASTNQLDAFSDLDLVVAIAPEHYENVMKQRHALAADMGELLAASTGEHVGEPRLLICLYDLDGELLHVDLKFVTPDELSKRVDNPRVLWEQDKIVTRHLGNEDGQYPIAPLQWFEDRFWIWVHYGATKIGRGEYFEALDLHNFIRQTVIVPLAKKHHGLQPNGIRRVEELLPELAKKLQFTLATCNCNDLVSATEQLAALFVTYRDLLAQSESLARRETAQQRAMEYLRMIGHNTNQQTQRDVIDDSQRDI